ncbi:MAG: bifunctional salicylyl-CoA 5-hydroxylase/oxidoreductase [Planctomycetes bacterium]|nr:bifunctional salicylyl-CoA 5-hydroxylase/oxidoreductase [Planctomycetota bacterium]MCW8136954.1 bifunctional salicylyl-CoA 5-hydroxylase/oxidoreductase [Planctomycetota bacterium]
MKIVSIGGGPAGLYFAILMKKQDPAHDITVIERNKPYDTFGWGVVFSDETLGGFEAADKPTFDRITREFAYWPDIDTFIHGQCIRSTGHGFAGMSRKRLLNIFQERCEQLGVKLVFDTEVKSLESYANADLILGADGVNSWVREHMKQHFKPEIDWRKCKFSWLGADFRLPAFTFIYEENEHGLFTVHAYPFDANTSTFIVECREETWKRAGLDKADEAQTIAYCERLFGKYLGGHKLLGNKSVWRTFPTIRNATWVHNNIVLLGDAAHTAHFSIGSGTKLAMEDAIELARAFADLPNQPVNAVLREYESRRWDETARLQKTAQTSLEWYENVARYFKTQSPIQFTFNQLTRSKRITYDNLRLRDPDFVQRATQWFADNNPHRGAHVPVPEYAKGTAADVTAAGHPGAAPPVFQPFQLRGLTLANRLVVSPMCQYSSDDGYPNDWHMVHLGSRAIGGAGLVYTEATHVSPEGRITQGCAGMYHPGHVAAWKRIVDFVKAHSRARICMQLAHAGRKASTALPWHGEGPLAGAQAWQTLAPSAIPYKQGWHVPREMNRADMDKAREDHVRAAKFACDAGFDMLELHYAHGYLMSTFISPITNKRSDGYGGSLEARMRFPLEVFDAVRAAWPEDRPISVRISATEWHEDGLTDADRLEIARMFKDHGLDIIDVSAGQVVSDQQPVYGRMFQTPFSDLIRNEAGLATMSVGNIQTVDQGNTILLSGRADLIVMARPHLFDPYTMQHAAADYEYDQQYWPPQYLAVKPRKRR